MKLEAFNTLERSAAADVLRGCNTSGRWIERMVMSRPYPDRQSLLTTATDIWADLEEADYLQAFDGHPKIGDPDSLKKKYAATLSQARKEQSGVESASDDIITKLGELNQQYLDKFGFIYIVFASGKSAADMLAIVERRMLNGRKQELQNAADEQRKITESRLLALFFYEGNP